ncbi:hypothetical protein [Chryseobacterium sediminis]|uniref:Uncharacterized protein n=1 Tax=Chryseobacterium sediminis TaxID=1679494 RepID=A0A5B2U7Y1_9FLAO|nr:hypothetical protein [Chryseobacterium sediminis]KAA2222831.1 hypothetical protein FW780_01120 [Chryseobacterium sediminis]
MTKNNSYILSIFNKSSLKRFEKSSVGATYSAYLRLSQQKTSYALGGKKMSLFNSFELFTILKFNDKGIYGYDCSDKSTGNRKA